MATLSHCKKQREYSDKDSTLNCTRTETTTKDKQDQMEEGKGASWCTRGKNKGSPHRSMQEARRRPTMAHTVGLNPTLAKGQRQHLAWRRKGGRPKHTNTPERNAHRNSKAYNTRTGIAWLHSACPRALPCPNWGAATATRSYGRRARRSTRYVPRNTVNHNSGTFEPAQNAVYQRFHDTPYAARRRR